MNKLEATLIEIERSVGSGSVVTDRDVLESYARDESEATPHLPVAVVRAQRTQDVVAVMRAASRHGIPVTPRAGGTGRTGGAVPVAGGIVLAFERCNRIKGIEPHDLVPTYQI